ncbi:hypothetical protein JW898_04550 [Candidatus Woesearchaeota archaeon]|nr:hypothetical protein [Candidatus Woesearchaeota archaeon]
MVNALKRMAYPGRGIVIGRTAEEELFVAYFVTGRSPSSQARRFGRKDRMIFTEPTDPKALATGNPDLLVYNAILWNEKPGVIAVSNGKQTDTLFSYGMCSSDVDIKEATRQWNFEPDEPNFTPRISGLVLLCDNDLTEAQMGIISRDARGAAVRSRFGMTAALDRCPDRGLAYLLTTYSGGNESPLPPFMGRPKKLVVEGTSAKEICEEVGGMLEERLRVSVAALCVPSEYGDYKPAIVNYRE